MNMQDDITIGVFDLYFVTLVGMSDHPGYSRDNITQPTLEDCAVKAIDMLKIREQYISTTNIGEL